MLMEVEDSQLFHGSAFLTLHSRDCCLRSQGALSISFNTFANSVTEMLHLYGTDNPAQLKSEVPHLPL